MSFLCALPLAAQLFGACAPAAPLAVGYVEGDYVLLAPIEVAQVDTVTVKRGDRVMPGTPVVTLESADARIAVAQAEAGLAQAQAQLADLQVGQLRLGLGQAGLGLRDSDLGVGAFQRHHGRAGHHTIAALDGDGLDLRHLDRRQQHIVALDIADGQRGGRRAGAEQLRGERQRTEKAHGLCPFLAASIALRLPDVAATTLAASAAPMSCQPMRRITASRPMRK